MAAPQLGDGEPVTEEEVLMGSQWGGTLPQIMESTALKRSGSSAMAGIRREAMEAEAAEREAPNFLLKKASSLIDSVWTDEFQEGPIPNTTTLFSPLGVDVDLNYALFGPLADSDFRESAGNKVGVVLDALTDFFETASGAMAMGYSRIDDKKIGVPGYLFGADQDFDLTSGRDILPDLSFDEAKEIGIGVAFELGANTRVGSYAREYKRLSENYENWQAAVQAGNTMAKLGLGEWDESYRELFVAPQLNDGKIGGDYLVPEGFDPRNPEDMQMLMQGPRRDEFQRRALVGEIIGTWWIGAAPFKVPKIIREGSRALNFAGVTQRNLGYAKVVRALEKQTDDYIASIDAGKPVSNAAAADAEFMARSTFDELRRANFAKFRRGNNPFGPVIAAIGAQIDNPRDAAVFLAAASGSVKYQKMLAQEKTYLADAMLRAKAVDAYEQLGWVKPPGFQLKPLLPDALEGTPGAALYDDTIRLAHRQGLIDDELIALQQMGLQGMTSAGTNWAFGKRIANAWRAGKANAEQVNLNRIDAVRKAMGLKPVQENPVAMPRLARDPKLRYVTDADGQRMSAMMPVSGIEEVTFQLSAHGRPVSILRWINGQRGTGYVPISGVRNDGSYGWDEISASLTDSKHVRQNPALLRKAEAMWGAALSESDRLQAVASIERMIVASMARAKGLKVTKADPNDPDEIMGVMEVYDLLAKRRTNTVDALKMRANRAYGFDPETGQMIIAHPRLVSQLETHVPMLDFKLMERTVNRMSSKTYKTLFRNPERVVAAEVKALRASSSIGAFFDELNSLWKFNVLIRGGYTIRNVGEAWMRSLAYLSAVPGVREDYMAQAAYNVIANRVTGVGRRRVKAREKQIENFLAQRDDELKLLREDQVRISGEIKKITDEATPATDDAVEGMTATVGDNPLLTRLQNQLAEVNEQVRKNREDASRYADELDDLSAQRGKYAKRKAGDLEGQAFAGLYGDMIRESAGNQRTVETFLQSRIGRAMDERDLNNWVRVNPGNKDYYNAYAQVYEQHMASPIHKMFAEGKSIDEVVEFLNSNKAIEIRDRLQIREGLGVLEYVSNEFRYFNYYFSTPRMKEMLLRDRYPTPTEIRGQLADKTLEELPVLYGPRRVPQSDQQFGVWAGVKKAQQRIFEWFGSMPESRLARHPFYAEQFALRRDELRSVARSQGLDLDDVEVIQKIERSAHAFARKRTDDIMFTIQRYSNPAAFFKFMSPFLAAGENALRTWGHIVTRDPSVLYRANVIWNLPNEVGMVYTYDMEPVPPKNLSFMTGEDEGTFLMMPKDWAERYEDLAKKVLPGDVGTGGMIPAVPKAGLNVVMQGSIPLIPGGFGPMVLVPTSLILYNKPNRQKTLRDMLGDRAYEMIAPFGRVQKPGVEMLLSGWERRLVQRVDNEDSVAYIGIRNNVSKNLLYEWMESGQEGPRPTADDVEQATNNWYSLHLAAAALGPAAVLPMSKYQTEISTYRRYLASMPLEAAMDRFIDQFGPEAVALIASTTKRNVGGVRSDIPSFDAVTGSEEFIKKFSDANKGASAASIIATATERDEFDPAVYTWLRDTKDYGTLKDYISQPTVEELQQQTVLTLAWRKYNELKEQRDLYLAAGMKKTNVDDWFREETKVKMADEFDYTARGKNLWLSTLQDFESKQATNLGIIANLLNDQEFRAGPYGSTNTWDLIEEYMDERDYYMRLKKSGLEAGVTRAMWESWKSGFKDSSFTFRNFYDVFLENDDLTKEISYRPSVAAGLKEAS